METTLGLVRSCLEESMKGSYPNHLSDRLQRLRLFLLEEHGCVYVIRVDLLALHMGPMVKPRGQGRGQNCPALTRYYWIDFRKLSDGDTAPMLWSQGLVQGLDPSTHRYTPPAGIPLAPLHQLVLGQLDSCSSHSFRPVDLREIAAQILLPTLNGILLGYPVCYVVDERSVEVASRYLSSSSTQLSIIRVLGTFTDRSGRRTDPLLSFSVPDSILTCPSEMRDGTPPTTCSWLQQWWAALQPAFLEAKSRGVLTAWELENLPKPHNQVIVL